MSWNPKYALLILTSTIITYVTALFIQKANIKGDIRQKKFYVLVSFLSNLLILFFFKYFNFLNNTFESIFIKLGYNWKVSNINILLPVGISFYTFQALSYTMDVYRGDLKPEKHFGKYALFVSFFPQLVAGPIERSTNLINQFYEEHVVDYDRIKNGLLLILWGLFKKVVIADKVSIIVNNVYNNTNDFNGFQYIIATLLFSVQIYCDFSAYSDIAIGSANVLGYRLMRNFNKPYFSKSISEFWRRWHMSLGTWFKDYLYFPLGGNRNKKLITYRNIAIVFLVSGLWHGANWTFVVWGGIHAIYQILGNELKTIKNFFITKLRINVNSRFYRFYRTFTTYSLVCFAWIFFRANSLTDAIVIIKGILLIDNIQLRDLLELGVDKEDFIIILISTIILFVSDFIGRNEIGKIKNIILTKPVCYRWSIYYFLIFFILIFGEYGSLSSSSFIYFQF